MYREINQKFLWFSITCVGRAIKITSLNNGEPNKEAIHLCIVVQSVWNFSEKSCYKSTRIVKYRGHEEMYYVIQQ